ncbi:hypothetical protein ABID29_001907 [Streptococcus rupicaprae]|uniref:Beta-carotene 15,15'-monooxygenase n=1 Tax=Streptococcus rupicaprae TaxID=759619 RepID=A0ABV2FJM2_9STRE
MIWTIFYLLVCSLLLFAILRTLFHINLKEYQGFTTRFFNNRDSSISTSSIIFWITLVPSFSMFSYLVANFLLNKWILTSYIWLLSPIFWIIEILWVILLNRFILINKSFILLISLASTILNFYLSRLMFTGNIKDILPDSSDTAWQLYVFISMFLVSLIQALYNQENYLLKRQKYIANKTVLYKKKYKILNNLDDNLQYLIIAILIKEDFERPPIFRVFEKLLHCKTRNIAQNDSQNDWHSIYILIRNIVEGLGKDDEKYSVKNIKRVIRGVNNSDDYIEDVYNLYYGLYVDRFR